MEDHFEAFCSPPTLTCLLGSPAPSGRLQLWALALAPLNGRFNTRV